MTTYDLVLLPSETAVVSCHKGAKNPKSAMSVPLWASLTVMFVQVTLGQRQTGVTLSAVHILF